MTTPPPPRLSGQATPTRRNLLLPLVTRHSLLPLLLSALFVVCAQAQAQNATGEPAVTVRGQAVTAAPAEDAELIAARGDINDPDSITTFTPTWQWQQADAPTSGVPTDGAYANIAGATAAAFTPLQEHVGKFLRVCANFRDAVDNQESRCWTSVAAVVNVNDAPVASNNTIFVPVGGSYTFSADDFPFTDEDGDALFRIVIGSSVPAAGAFSLSGTTVSPSLSIQPAQLDARLLTYTPPTDATAAMAGYASFNFTVRTGGSVFNVKSSATRTITIDLISPTASAATGTATVTAASGIAYHEGAELTADIGTVADANGLPARNLMWQWQFAAAPDTGVPATSTYANINGATAATFAPGRAQVGQYIRVCLRFTDGIGTAEMRCSVGNVIARANSVSVPITASESEPYVFKPSDFMFPDDPTGNLESVPVVTSIADGKGIFRLRDSVAIEDNLTVSGDSIRSGNLIYYPPDSSVAAPNFATFTYIVNYRGTGNTETRTMNIHLVEHLRLRLRLFLEGPLR